MLYLTFMTLALPIVFANPLTYDSTDPSINTNLILDLDSPNDLFSQDSLNDPPLPQDTFIEATTPAIDCVLEASTDDSDATLVLKRDLNACPSNLIPHKSSGDRKRKSKTPGSPIPVQRGQPTTDRQRITEEDDNSKCENYYPHSRHVTCAGPECGIIDQLIATVLNCRPGRKSLRNIQKLPDLAEYPPKAVEEYCCEEYGSDVIFQSATNCAKLGNTPIPGITISKFQNLIAQAKKKYGQ